MPRAPRQCAYPGGCENRITTSKYCPTHTQHNWHTSDRASRLPGDWRTRRDRTRRRAHGQCEATLDNGTRCPSPGTECDHVERGDNHDLSNLAWLCSHHHKVKTQREATEARAARTVLRKRTD